MFLKKASFLGARMAASHLEYGRAAATRRRGLGSTLYSSATHVWHGRVSKPTSDRVA